MPVANQVVLRIAEHVRRFPPAAVTLPSGAPSGAPVTRMLIFSPGNGLPLKSGNFNYLWRRAWKAAGYLTAGGRMGTT